MDIIKSIEHEQMKSKIPYLKVGDTVKVKVYEIDDQDRINLITKELDDIRKAEKEEREKAKSEKDNKDE